GGGLACTRRRSASGNRAATTSRGVRSLCAMACPSCRAAAAGAAPSAPWCPRSSEKCHRVHVDRPLVAHGHAVENAFGITAQNDLRAIAAGAFRRERGRGTEHLGVVSGGLAKPRRELARSPLHGLDLFRLRR